MPGYGEPQRSLPEQDPEGTTCGWWGAQQRQPWNRPHWSAGLTPGAAPRPSRHLPPGAYAPPCLQPCQVWGHIHITLVGVDAVQTRPRVPSTSRAGGPGGRRACWLPGALWPGPPPPRRAELTFCLLVVVEVVHITGQAEVGDFHHVVLGHQHVAGMSPYGCTWGVGARV